MIVGKKVNLIALEKEHLKLLHKWDNDPEFRRIVGPYFPVSMLEKEKWFEQVAVSENKKVFMIQTKDRENIGYMYLNVDWVHRKAELAIAIGEKKFWGKGYGTDATKTLLKHGFHELDLNRIYVYVFAFNKKAIQLYKKCGFKREGLIRGDYLIRGKHQDRLIMSVLKKEFKPR